MEEMEIEQLRAECNRLKGLLDEAQNAEFLIKEIAFLQEQNTLLAERIGCGCGGDYGICNECTAALTGNSS